MSNDNKTLADVQPGGRVRLGDALPPLPCTGYSAYSDGTEPLYTAEQMREYALAALSAHPSPGGQDALASLPLYRLADDANGIRGLHRDDTGSWVKLQDVERALAVRQPVEQQPAFFANRWEMEHGTAPGLVAMRAGKHLGIRDFFTVPLYTAPPAQAVDLGAVRALLQRRIEQWRSHLPTDPGAPGTREIETKGEHDYNNDVRIYREGIAVMEEVLSKIDSQGAR